MGDADEPVRIVPYDPVWPARFEEERRLIEATLGSWIRGGVHHVGSTAVPGLAAKPTIDIMVGVTDLEAARPCIDLLSKIDYCYWPYRPEIMHWFCKPSPSRRTYHLHMMEPSGPEWALRLAFRDFLRTNPETAAEYERVKRQLALAHEHDREAYTEGKGDFVRSVVTRALAARSAWAS
jgi:GrpB-like predicted nucleotidyltransferase (UPF0157 family)